MFRLTRKIILPKTIVFITVIAFFTACTNKDYEKSGGGFGEVGGDKSPFKVVVDTTWESTQIKTTEGVCEIPPQSDPGTNTDCTVVIPEARLYFSDLTFTMSTVLRYCDQIVMQLYYYLASNSAGFLPAWANSPIDCSQPNIPKECYSGPATLVQEFPKYTGIYFVVDVSRVLDFKISSANSLHRGSNRWTSNSLANEFRAQSKSIPGDGYVGGTFRDYHFSCRDKWGDEIHSINLEIQDEDSPPDSILPNVDHYSAWNKYFP